MRPHFAANALPPSTAFRLQAAQDAGLKRSCHIEIDAGRINLGFFRPAENIGSLKDAP